MHDSFTSYTSLQQFITPSNDQVLQDLTTQMNIGMTSVKTGSKPKPRSARDLLDKKQVEAVHQLAATLSQNALRREAAEQSQKTAIQVDSDSSDGIREVFNHDESEDEEYFEMNKAANRKFPFCYRPRINKYIYIYIDIY